MGLKKLAKKVAEYNDRLVQGKVEKIKPDHVKKVLEKLYKKASDLEAEIAFAKNPEKKARSTRKLSIARQHIERAKWLLKEID
jgi:hypothetical protein